MGDKGSSIGAIATTGGGGGKIIEDESKGVSEESSPISLFVSILLSKICVVIPESDCGGEIISANHECRSISETVRRVRRLTDKVFDKKSTISSD